MIVIGLIGVFLASYFNGGDQTNTVNTVTPVNSK